MDARIKFIPLYLSITVENQPEAKIKLVQAVKSSLEIVLNKDTSNQELQYQYGNLEKIYTFPIQFHITTFFMGKSKNKITSEFYQSFQRNLEFDLKIYGFVIAPNKIITAICNKTDYEPIKIENMYAHITTMIGEFKAKDSNTLLETIFTTNANLFQEVINSVQDKQWFLNINMFNQNISCFVVAFKDKIILKGKTQFH